MLIGDDSVLINGDLMCMSVNSVQLVLTPGLMRYVLWSLLDCADPTSTHSFYLTPIYWTETLSGSLFDYVQRCTDTVPD
jgi:hypothetical protein